MWAKPDLEVELEAELPRMLIKVAVGSRAVSLAKKLAPRVPIDLFVFTPQEVSQGGRFLEYVQHHGRRLL